VARDEEIVEDDDKANTLYHIDTQDNVTDHDIPQQLPARDSHSGKMTAHNDNPNQDLRWPLG
jgi:hypothetical protein